MAEEKQQEITFGAQPYQFGQDAPQVPQASAADEPTGVEDVSYERATMQGAPEPPQGVRGLMSGDVVRFDASGRLRMPRSENDSGVTGTDRKIRAWRDYLDTLDAPETQAEREKRERGEKSARIVSAVSDGLRALGNLFFTTRYAPNMYNHEKESQLGAQNAAIERARKEREANADKYLRYTLALGDAENERARTTREMEAEQERRMLAKEKAEREAKAAERAALLFPDQQREQAGKADTAEHKARTAQAEADYAPELQRRKGAALDAEIAQRRASAANSYASAANSRALAAARNRTNQQVNHHFNGKAYPDGSKDYDKDVREAARLYNERHGKWIDKVDSNGKHEREWVYDEGFAPIQTDYEDQHGVVRPIKAEEYAGEVETRLAKEREDSAPPSRRVNKNNTPPSRR